MTRCPTTLEMYVCTTPVALVKMAIAIIPATVRVRTVSLCWKMPMSSASRSRNGLSSPTPADSAISAITATSRHRYGLNSARIRRESRSRVGSSSGGGFLSGPPRSARIDPGVAPCAAPIPRFPVLMLRP